MTRFNDFFSTSECRDLLFHVQEHRLTLAQIQAFLDANNLTFLGFELDRGERRAIIAQRFPDDPAMTDLERWEPSNVSARYLRRHVPVLGPADIAALWKFRQLGLQSLARAAAMLLRKTSQLLEDLVYDAIYHRWSCDSAFGAQCHLCNTRRKTRHAGLWVAPFFVACEGT